MESLGLEGVSIQTRRVCGLPGGDDGSRVVEGHRGVGETVGPPHLVDQPEGSPVGVVRDDQVVARLEQPQDGVLGGQTAGKGQTVAGAFQRGQARFEGRPGGIAAAGVLEAPVLADGVLGEGRGQ